MTTVLDPPSAPTAPAPASRVSSAPLAPDGPATPAPDEQQPEPVDRLDTGRLRTLLALWVVALAVGMAFVVYGLGPFFQERDQRSLIRTFRAEVSRAANEASGLAGVTVPTKAPEAGAPVAVLEIGALRMQQVVVEGVASSQTRAAPGHVPGTAGLGQPGNAVVVGRRTAFGGPFSSAPGLVPGDEVLVTTRQGQSVYKVSSVRRVTLHAAKEDEKSPIDSVYGPSKADQLTIVTSARWFPWNKSQAVVAVAKLEGTPFAPTPQGGRSDSQLGTRGDAGANASAILALLVYGVAMGASIVLYRRLQPRTAYLLTIAPILALTIVAAETMSRVFPAWM